MVHDTEFITTFCVNKDGIMSAVLSRPPEKAASDDLLYEVVDGQFVEKPVGAYSGLLALHLFKLLDEFVSQQRLGTVVTEIVFILDTKRDLRRRPDVAFVSAEKWPIGQLPPPEGDWAVIPDLAVEVLSPQEEARKSLKKVNEYFRYGVREVWVAAPEERMVYCYSDPKTVRILDANDTLSTTLLPGWTANVGTWLPVIPAK
jgi:Uma2 family endonuclease